MTVNMKLVAYNSNYEHNKEKADMGMGAVAPTKNEELGPLLPENFRNLTLKSVYFSHFGAEKTTASVL